MKVAWGNVSQTDDLDGWEETARKGRVDRATWEIAERLADKLGLDHEGHEALSELVHAAADRRAARTAAAERKTRETADELETQRDAECSDFEDDDVADEDDIVLPRPKSVRRRWIAAEKYEAAERALNDERRARLTAERTLATLRRATDRLLDELNALRQKDAVVWTDDDFK